MIKNYTSEVPAEKTIMKIEFTLIEFGAIGIMKDYKGGQLVAINFSIPKAGGGLWAIRLPADVDQVYEILRAKYKRPHRLTSASERNIREQAQRTAWKLMLDWVLVQLSLVTMRQAEFIQVFLPYAWDGRQTVFARLKAGGFKLLEAPKVRSSADAEPIDAEVVKP